ncbi:membrane protein [Clostridium acetobutylicum EA 2018]|uniref:Predicted membrane protein n=1 Tax=Clostridium acetobutylicum (strain ATCC 824 / DSM 792 / JCM 1419 / IAM 19013 / LMG 5710 / NBRC 13948 / NRRL B-527 / VKM B-1787 / 2291 / W) TaxID=272562 RepID=Q97J77_CLOAB|nr:Predicted membrane protein [Clostridium acetobutylicum ATCC 824]ADZ20462.1 membrane protein [Clostridium acetobutylicum EA 2018]AEI31793.1 hypothetical protein SMB_G1434 [Clostridium acetobutylicum DSM 1731]AWV81374.1 hypothetical protein DK921_14990 [Clostridium acetobutylicum]PSM04658.1 hypothetical protein C7T89_14985 [Clostridium sp. NJ4]
MYIILSFSVNNFIILNIAKNINSFKIKKQFKVIFYLPQTAFIVFYDCVFTILSNFVLLSRTNFFNA